MAQKRSLWERVETEASLVFPDAKRRRNLVDSIREAIAARSMHPYFPEMEPFLRRVVQEEVQNALCRFTTLTPRDPINKIQTTASKSYKLQFRNSLPGTLFTSNKIEAEGQKPVEIVIVDSLSKNVVEIGPFSSVRVEILVLDGDFASDGQEEWSEREFDSSIVPEREGKRPLLTGRLEVTLNNGIGQLADVNFTDNSSWIRSRKFRLGARVTPRSDIVLEAISGAFVVKDHRGEAYKKHHPPSLSDDVWRLEKIGKGGVFHQKLEKYGILTVQDFLKKLVIDQDGLRNLLGMSNKMWDAAVEHAWECIIPKNKLYAYYSDGAVLLFDPIYQLVGAMINANIYFLEEIPASQCALVNQLKQDAYRSPNLIVEVNQQLSNNFQGLLSSTTEHPTIPTQSWSNEHVPLPPVVIQGDPEPYPVTSHLQIPLGNDLIEDINQRKFDLSEHSNYTKQPLPTTDFDLHCCDTFFSSLGTTESTSNADSAIGMNSNINALHYSSLSPILSYNADDFVQIPVAEVSGSDRTSVPRVHSGASPVNWNKLVAALGG